MSKKAIFLSIFVLIVILAVMAWLWINKGKVFNGGTAPRQKVYKIGLLQMASTVNPNIDGFKAGMAELGYVEGENTQYIYLNAEGDTKLIVEYAKQLVEMKPDLIFTNTSPAASAAKDATKNTGIPVVFSMVGDPVGAGFVESMKSSGNNLTGTSCAYVEIASKRLEILKEVDPMIKKVMVLYRPQDKSGGPATIKIQEAAPKLRVEIIAKPVTSVDEIRSVLANLKSGEADALMDPGDSMVNSTADLFVAASLRLKIPVMMLTGKEPEMGVLAGYGVNYFDLGKQNAPLANKILKENISPSQIPVEMPRKFMFVLNLITAKKIGLSISSSVLAKADKLISE